MESGDSENLNANTPIRTFHKTENSSCVLIASDELARPIRAVADSIKQQLTHFLKLTRKLKNE